MLLPRGSIGLTRAGGRGTRCNARRKYLLHPRTDRRKELGAMPKQGPGSEVSALGPALVVLGRPSDEPLEHAEVALVHEVL